MYYNLKAIAKFLKNNKICLREIFIYLKSQWFRKTCEEKHYWKNWKMYEVYTYIRENEKTKDIILIYNNFNYKWVDFEINIEKWIEFIWRNRSDFSKQPYDELLEEYFYKIK